MKQKIMAVVILVFCLGFYLPAQQNPPKITLVPVAGPVYVLQGGGGNIGIVADPAGIFMIDAMMEPVIGQIREAIKVQPGGERVRVLVNTHWHSDHTDGNKALGPGAVIIAHENVRTLLAKDQTLMGGQTKALPANALPGVTFSDKLTVYAGGEAIRLVHFPHAHTDGDTVVFLDGLKVVHMGDMFFNGMFPFLDVANGGDIDGWVRQLDIILGALPADTKIIPGHGPLAGIADLKAFRDMLAASADLVRKQMKAGKTMDEIKAAGVPDNLAAWAKGFLKAPQWLELVYRSLEKGADR
ncbi:MAG: MBL fold metallo-hydrolase [Candidatus Aminicenantes bacterium]|nr:MBL fold metallo-hydrolase [Candidatus Aminicenantes bacterium]